MKITIVLTESIYDCQIQITDSYGRRDYYISAAGEKDETPSVTAEIFDNEFELMLVPIVSDVSSALNEFDAKSLKERFAKKAVDILFSALDKMLLRVGCSYHIQGLQDGDRLDISLQQYVFGTFDRFDLFELLPMIYVFFEAANFNKRFVLTDAFETNRKDVLKSARSLAFSDAFGNGILMSFITYPIQVGRIKHLTKNKKIRKTLTKFNNLNNDERQRFLEKQEKFFE